MKNLTNLMNTRIGEHSYDIQTDLQLDRIHKQNFFQRLAGLLLMTIPIIAIVDVIIHWLNNNALIDPLNLLILTVLFFSTLVSLYLNKNGYYDLAVVIFLALGVIGLTLTSVISTHVELSFFYFTIILSLGKPLLSKRGLFILMIWMLCIVIVTDTLGIYSAPIAKERVMIFIFSSYVVLFIITLFRNQLETERRAILQKNDDRLKWMIHQLPAIIWTIENNHEAQILPSAYSNNLSHFNFNEFIKSDEVAENISVSQTSDASLDFEYELDNYIYYTQIEPLRDGDGVVIGSIGITTDVTIQKIQAQFEWDMTLEHKRIEILKEFLSTASHDLRTPLSSLHLSTYLLNKTELDEKQADHLERVIESTERITNAIDKMFMVLRLNLDNEDMEQVYDVVSMIREVVQSFEATNSKPYVKIDCLFDLSAAYIYGDEKLMSNALFNIIENSVDNIDRVGTITVNLRRENNNILISVRDTGRGIPTIDLPKVTNAFYRVSKHRPGNHVGLGLTISKNIIDKHGGALTIDSSVDVGTDVSISLPIQNVTF